MNAPGAEKSGVAVVLTAALVLVLAVSAAEATTVTFRQGENSYTSARDTFLQQNPPSAGTNNGAAQNWNWDSDDPNGTGYDVYTLIRFDNIIGTGPGQIPPNAQITSATLSYMVYNNGGDGDLHEVLVSWEDTATYNSFCAGGCNEGSQFGPKVGTAPAAALATQSADVTATVQKWANGTVNRGWFISTTGTDGVDVRSSEYGTITERPMLRVVYNEGPPTSHIVREPYLQLGTPTTMTIVWRTDVTSDSRVQYGTVYGTYDRSATNATVGSDHYVTVTGLTPSTRYYYTVGSTTSQQGGGTAEHYFVTSPPAGTASPFTFWIFGDSGICSNVQNQVRDSMLTYTGADRPDLFLHAGDVAQVSGADDEYTNCHLAYYKDVMRHTPFWPAMGNHDSYSTTCQDPGPCSGPYFSTFVLPTNAEAGGYASNTEAYYSYDYANAHFIALNGANVSRSSTGPMANWLRNDLASTSQQWVIAYWHQPPYTKGTHDSDAEGDLIEMRQNIIPILEAAGVDLILNGHSHGYERSYLIDGTYSTPTPTYSTLVANGNIKDDGDGRPTGSGEYRKSPGKTPHEGTVYVVTATGGQPPGGAHGHPVMYYAESANGSTLVDVLANELRLTFLRSDGTVRDTFTILKGDLPPRVQSTVPPKASVISSLPSVEVTFNMDVTGVDAQDLTVNGSPAAQVTPTGARVYLFTGYATPGQGTVNVLLAPGGIASATNPANTFQGDSWTYTIDTSPPRVVSETPARGAVIGALPSVTVAFNKPVRNVTAADLSVNGSPATSVSGLDGTAGPYVFTGYATPPNGLVTVTLAAWATSGIQDTDGRPFGGDAWNYALTRRLIINEFLASNNTAAQDEYGEFDDYVEIYNPTDATVDMSGMFLTDDLDSKSQYRIPSGVTVPPHGYIVFWCDSTPSQGPRHTNFNIARTGEDLGLFDTDENGLAAIDTLTFTTQTTDIASGRFPDGQDGFVTMPVTPGAPNTISCTGSPECSALTDACNVGICSGNRCVAQHANEGGICDDGVACTAPDTCLSGVCNGGVDTCPSGQTCNHGTGICESTPLDPLPIDVGETWRYFKGTQEPTPSDLTAWAGLAYDDATWLQGPSGFGYGADCTAQRGTLLSDMQNPPSTPGYTSVYLRKAFQVSNPGAVTSLTLTVDYDDAFVAYLNGTEVARSSNTGGVAGTPLPYNYALPTSTNHECSVCDTAGLCNPAGAFDLTAYKSLLVTGSNIIAVHGLNTTLASSDFTVTPTLSSTENLGCQFDSQCNDNNPCTDDVCNLLTGICTNPVDNTNPCTDSVACTTDSCSSGTCISTDSCLFGQTCNHSTGVCESAPVTVTFQDGVNSYAGTQDTYLYQSGPATVEGSLDTWRWDTDDPPSSGLWEYGLVRFDNIFGNGTGQVPEGATISSATLSIYLSNGSVAPAGSINEVIVDWTEATATWNNFGGDAGVQADEYGNLVGSTPLPIGTATIDVTASLRAWVNSPASNYGWIFRPNNTDGVAVSSSENATLANRPKLTVTYVPPGATCTGDPDCDDGNFCNGLERCVSSFCQVGTPPSCDDGVACTTDTCNETTDSCDHAANNAACGDGNVCTDDTCDVALGCQHVNNTASCSDGNACTTTDVCSAGVCVGSGSLTCNDGLACTTDSCVPPTGCQYVDNCTGGRTCNHTTGVCESGPVTITFQQGVGAYTGAVDTYIDAALGSQATTTPIVVDGSPAEHVLIRFDGIFGSGANQIPPGSTIASATLTLRVGSGTNDQSENAVNYHRLLHPWVATDVWAAYGVSPWNSQGGIQADGVDALVTIEATATMITASTAYPVSVTGSVQAWSTDPASNYGWAILPTGTDGLRLESSESTTASYRPLLSVTYTPSAGCTSDPECSDGLWCNGAETCNLATQTCQAGTPPTCNDGIACTTDACDETNDQCYYTANNAACNDGNVCTTDTCDVGLGCQYVNNTVSCSDGNACTTGDVCSGGACQAGTPVTCNDNIACTTDSCVPASGCQYIDNCPTGQSCNHTSGVCEASTAPPLPINVGDTWKYFKGTSEPSTSWTAIAFDDASWLSGPSGFGYGTDCQSQHATVLSDMQNPPSSPGYVSIYLRKQFRVDNPASITTLTLTVDYDDAFVAYINGSEVARRNVTGTPPSYSQLATADHECSVCNGSCNAAEAIDLTSYKSLLVSGTNVLSIQAHNLTLNSTDFTMTPSMTSTTGGCTSNEQCSDNNVCNGAETCVGGLCQPGTPLNCSDGNVCTTDSCNPTSGCSNPPAPAGTSCTDGNACNGAETCNGAGTCVAGTPPNCNDGIACTNDSCDPALGCRNLDNCPMGQTCNHTSGICETGPVTVTFRQGTSGYAGTVDTYLVKGNPTVNNAVANPLIVDGGPDADIRQILLRFEHLFASDGGPIPDGAQITSATLTINVTNISLDGAELHRMLVPWADTATWNSMVNGIQTDNVEAVSTYDAKSTYNTLGLWTFDVTPSLAAWSAGAVNRGWAWMPPAGGTDSWQFDSAEGTTPPLLSVTYQVVNQIRARMTCTLGTATAAPGGTAGLETKLENLGGLAPVRGYETQLRITRTGGSGAVTVPCPGGVSIDDGRTDYLYYGRTDDYPVTNCGLMRASSSIPVGGVTVGGTPAYMSSYTLAVSPDAAPGSTFEITFAPYPDSSLADENSDPINFEIGPVCVLTVGSCGTNQQCDDGNPCTDDTCASGICQNTPNPANTCDDANACTTDDHCTAGGACVGAAPLLCNDSNVCTLDSCNPASGCVFTPTPGASCSDGNACTSDDTCNSSGVCVAGTPVNCNDGNVCTDDSCSPAAGCVHTANTASCDDGNACTLGDVCSSGTCQPGPPMDCNDFDICTTDACSAGQCVHGASGLCGVNGTVYYYRDSSTSSEPSTKPTPRVDLDATGDTSPEASTGSTGTYAIGNLFGNVTVRTLNKYGTPRASDHNDAVSSFDAVAIARYAVGLSPLSANQQVAGDVSGSGSVTSYDAAKVAQFAVELIDHFEVATASGSDWRLMRCDHYTSADSQDCGPALYTHNPLAGMATDNFYAVLYGEVTGNWAPSAGFAAAAAAQAESSAVAQDRQDAQQLRAQGVRIRPRRPDLSEAVLTVSGWPRVLAAGSRAEVSLVLGDADGIEALDLRLLYDTARMRVVEVRQGALASSFKMVNNDLGGDRRIGMYGVLPLSGSGTALTIVVEAREDVSMAQPFAIDVSANEGRIPVRTLQQPAGRVVPRREPARRTQGD